MTTRKRPATPAQEEQVLTPPPEPSRETPRMAADLVDGQPVIAAAEVAGAQDGPGEEVTDA